MSVAEKNAQWRSALAKPQRMLVEMMLIRRVEESLGKWFAAGEFGGFLHLSIGQEAVAVGIASARQPGDFLTLTHRSHGHLIAAGIRLSAMLAEIYWRRDGLAGGFAGHVHMGDLEQQILGGNGVLGQNQPIAVGLALGLKLAKKKRIVVSVFGEGTANEGVVSEALNLSMVWRVPVLWVCERNEYAQLTGWHVHQGTESLADRARGFGIPAETLDGNDVEGVAEAADRYSRLVREREQPAFLEVRCVRWEGHYVGDPQKYRFGSEIESGVDPIKVLTQRHADMVDAPFLREAEERIEKEIEAAAEFARRSPKIAWKEYLEQMSAVGLSSLKPSR